jgi:hypothetical protein
MGIPLSSRETTGGALMEQRSRQLAEPAVHLLSVITVPMSRLRQAPDAVPARLEDRHELTRSCRARHVLYRLEV